MKGLINGQRKVVFLVVLSLLFVSLPFAESFTIYLFSQRSLGLQFSAREIKFQWGRVAIKDFDFSERAENPRFYGRGEELLFSTIPFSTSIPWIKTLFVEGRNIEIRNDIEKSESHLLAGEVSHLRGELRCFDRGLIVIRTLRADGEGSRIEIHGSLRAKGEMDLNAVLVIEDEGKKNWPRVLGTDLFEKRTLGGPLTLHLKISGSLRQPSVNFVSDLVRFEFKVK